MPENNQMMSVEGQLVGMPLAGPESFSQQQLAYLKRALGVDETVLFDGNGTPVSRATLSESPFNFEKIRISIAENLGDYHIEEKTIVIRSGANYINLGFVTGGTNVIVVNARYAITSSSITCDKVMDMKTNYTNGTSLTIEHVTALLTNIYKVVGVNRIAST